MYKSDMLQEDTDTNAQQTLTNVDICQASFVTSGQTEVQM